MIDPLSRPDGVAVHAGASSRVAELLEAALAPNRFRSLRLEADRWRARPQTPEAPRAGRQSIEGWRMRLWFQAPDMLREEGDPLGDDGARVVTVAAGSGGGSSQALAGAQLSHLIDPAPLLGALSLVGGGRLRLAGREATRLTGRPRTLWAGRMRPVGLLPGADSFDLAIDDRTGVLLMVSARRAGREIGRDMVTDLAVDETLDQALFALSSHTSDGLLEEGAMHPQRTSLAEASRICPFTVLAPRVLLEIPGAGEIEAEVIEQAGDLEGALMFTIAISERESVGVVQTRARASAPEPGEQSVILGGERFRVVDEQGKQGGQGGRRRVRFTREGTEIRLLGDLSADQLLALAASFIPVAGSGGPVTRGPG